MSMNESTVYVFVKGNKGKCAYEVTDTFGTVIQSQIFDNLKDDQGAPLYQSHSDWLAAIKALEFIRDNRGRSKVPEEPMIFIFTTYENIYHIASTLKNPCADSSKKYLDKINELKPQLTRKSKIKSVDENVKFQYLPASFENKMDEVDQLLGNNKKKKSNRL